MTKGYDTLRLGCGDDTRPDHWNVDVVERPGVDETHDLDDRPWPWDDESFQYIVAEHVFEHLEDMEAALRECARVLEYGGRATIRLPMGRDAYADAGHVWGERGLPWTWRTPARLAGQRHWDTDVGLRVVRRDIDLWSVAPWLPEKAYQHAKWGTKLRLFGPGEWCFGLPQSCGEFTVVFERR